MRLRSGRGHMGVLLGFYCLGKEELSPQSHCPGEASGRALTWGLPRPVSVYADLDQGRAIRKLYLKGRCSVALSAMGPGMWSLESIAAKPFLGLLWV